MFSERVELVNTTEVSIIETSSMKNEFFNEGDGNIWAESGRMREVSWGEMEDGKISLDFGWNRVGKNFVLHFK